MSTNRSMTDAAQIERLKALVRDVSATRDTAVNMKLERDAEIARLRDQVVLLLTKIIELEFAKRRPQR
jgi:hypothetical protein